ncbi:MAG: D-alanyl-D-alanine carboxypeptidase/D-alanyl-D-alanine-endopeptidase [Gammaproteobacteria bacterium]|jgi:serine-type D-Ala-D-Ala carboxypeptidase/endopeptidase (penicillin-binding protein 4)|nr:D-alanyl-D-alanine carboxypeptidase/D-alanyl-D-alanine-endopeptidase [Gammaproteobacteria bacterium]
MMKKRSLRLFYQSLLFLFFQHAVLATPLPRSLEIITDGHQLPDSNYSILVQEVGSTDPLLSINADKPLNPASAIKIITTLAALEELGPAYIWPTEIYTLGKVKNGTLHGDLLIKGYGDPYMVTENFWKLLQEIQRQGISQIKGDLIIDDSYFAVANTDPGEFDNKPDRAYNVLPNALLVNFKAAYFHFYPADNGKSVVVKSDPELPNLRIQNNLKLSNARCGGFQRGIAINILQGQKKDRVSFDGRYSRHCGHYVMSRTVLTQHTYTFGVFLSLWQQLGGSISGTVRKGLAPIDRKPVISWQSRPLGELIRLVNKFSNNVMTRQLLLTLAAQSKNIPATVENGRIFINDYLQGHGIDTASLNLVNGAGLSRDVRVSAHLMADTLLHADSIPFMPEFVSSLSIMGMDGTAKNRLRRRIKSGHAHIKTGTIDHVSAIAGFVDAISGKRFVIVGMLNHQDAHRGPGEELMNALVEWTYRQ